MVFDETHSVVKSFAETIPMHQFAADTVMIGKDIEPR